MEMARVWQVIDNELDVNFESKYGIHAITIALGYYSERLSTMDLTQIILFSLRHKLPAVTNLDQEFH